MSEQSEIPRRLVRAEQVLAARTRRVSLVLESSQDPHNVHAVLRSAEAFGVQDVHVVSPRGEAAAISAGVTQRAHEWLTVHRHRDIDSAIVAVRAEGREVWATAIADEARSLAGLVPRGPVAIILGNESDGISPRARELADTLVRIDLVGFSGSLNLSVAAAIVLWELRRGELDGPSAGNLSPAERTELRARWYPPLLSRKAGDPLVTEWLGRAEEVEDAAREAPRSIAPERSPSGEPSRASTREPAR